MFKKNPFYESSHASTTWATPEIELGAAVVILILLINLLASSMFIHDKRQAIAGGWRIPERILLGLALLGGSPAILIARRMVRHKTRKQPFVSFLYGIVLLQLVLVLCGLYVGLYLPNTL